MARLCGFFSTGNQLHSAFEFSYNVLHIEKVSLSLCMGCIVWTYHWKVITRIDLFTYEEELVWKITFTTMEKVSKLDFDTLPAACDRWSYHWGYWNLFTLFTEKVVGHALILFLSCKALAHCHFNQWLFKLDMGGCFISRWGRGMRPNSGVHACWRKYVWGGKNLVRLGTRIL